MPIGLDHPDALDPRCAGAKASRLAVARRAGLSVLDGVVVEVAHSLPFLAAAVRGAAENGPAASQLAMMEVELKAGLADAVRGAVRCDRLVVRSSSPVEGTGEWSGAFASYLDVRPDDLETAIRGCWASMLGRDARERFERAGRDPAATGMAVLVQPAITPAPGGVAEVGDDAVRVTVAEDGKLAGLLQGWARGRSAEVPRSGAPSGPAVEAHGAALLRQVGDLARACHERTGDNHLEWAFGDGCCYVLQSRREVRPARPAGSAPPRHPRRAGAAAAARPLADIARAVARFGGESGDELLLPWCFAPGGIRPLQSGGLQSGALQSGALQSGAPQSGSPQSGPPHSGPPHWGGGAETDPARNVSAAGARSAAAPASAASLRSAARALTAQAWGTDADEAMGRARAVLSRLRDRLDPNAARELQALAPVDTGTGRLLLDAVQRAAATAVAAAQLFDPADAWRLPPALLDQLLDGEAVRSQGTPAAGPWEAFLCEAILTSGQHTCSGEPASAGIGAGRLLTLAGPRRLSGTRERWILHVASPVPAYAPLLWGAAGLISATGSASAHLFDVARTLGVPAVAGVELPGEVGPEPVAAVDGFTGEIVIL